MSVYDPTHPGETLQDCIHDFPLTMTSTVLVCISRTTLYRVLSGQQPITVGMALGLERLGWSNAEFWMRRQMSYDLAMARGCAA